MSIEEITDSAYVIVEWEGASLKLAIDCTSAEHLTPEDIGNMVTHCLTEALSAEANKCATN